MSSDLFDIYGVTSKNVLPVGGAAGQVLAKNSTVDSDVVWIDINRRAEQFSSVDLLGLNAVNLDCSSFDIFELTNINGPCGVTLNNFTPGMTTMIVLHNAINKITFTNTILWRGSAPDFTADTDMVVLTALTSSIIGSYSPGYK